MDGLERFLLEKYDPTNARLKEPLWAPASLDKSEELPTIKEGDNVSPEGSRKAVDNISPVTKALLKLIRKIHKKED